MKKQQTLKQIYEDFHSSYIEKISRLSETVVFNFMGARLLPLGVEASDMRSYTCRKFFSVDEGEVLCLLAEVSPSVKEIRRIAKSGISLSLVDGAGDDWSHIIQNYELIPAGDPDHVFLRVRFVTSGYNICFEKLLFLRLAIGEECVGGDVYRLFLKKFKETIPQIQVTNFMLSLDTDRPESVVSYLSFKEKENRSVHVAACMNKLHLESKQSGVLHPVNDWLDFLEYECRIVDTDRNTIFSNFHSFFENPLNEDEWCVSEYIDMHSYASGSYYCCIYFMGEIVVEAPFEIGEEKVGRMNLLAIQPNLLKETIRKPQENALRTLHGLIGLKEVKKAVMRNCCYAKLMKTREQLGLRAPKRILHTVMTGNPGTGKTTVARILGSVYHEMGLLSKGHLVEVNREALTDSVIGGSEKRTKEFIERAKGGILFVDEAYSLTPADKNDRDFGRQVLDTLMPVLSEPDDLIVIFAGYTEEMSRLFNTNPGLASRFPVRYTFEDFSLDELMQMAQSYFFQNGFLPTDKALEKIRKVFQEAMKYKDYGNGRFVKTYIENVILTNMAERLFDRLDDQVEDSKMLSEIIPEDVPDLLDSEFTLLARTMERRKQVKGFRTLQADGGY